MYKYIIASGGDQFNGISLAMLVTFFFIFFLVIVLILLGKKPYFDHMANLPFDHFKNDDEK
jgi:cbb3-type cytochrome oxidase subunit 3